MQWRQRNRSFDGVLDVRCDEFRSSDRFPSVNNSMSDSSEGFGFRLAHAQQGDDLLESHLVVVQLAILMQSERRKSNQIKSNRKSNQIKSKIQKIALECTSGGPVTP